MAGFDPATHAMTAQPHRRPTRPGTTQRIASPPGPPLPWGEGFAREGTRPRLRGSSVDTWFDPLPSSPFQGEGFVVFGNEPLGNEPKRQKEARLPL